MKLLKKILALVGVIIFIFFLFTIDFKESLSKLTELSATSVFLLVLLTFLNILTKALRWKFLIARIAQTSIGIGFSFWSIIMGIAASAIVPGRIEFAKPIVLKTAKNVSLSKSFSALIIERVLDLLTLLFFLVVSLWFVPRQSIISNYVIFSMFLFTVALTIALTLFPKPFLIAIKGILLRLPFRDGIKVKIETFAQHILESFATFKIRSSVFLYMLLSFIANGLEIVRFYLLFMFLGLILPPALVTFSFAASIIIGIISTIPGGVGITELSESEILINLWPSAPHALVRTAVIIDRIVAYYILVIIGSIVLMFQERVKPGRYG